MQNITIKYNFTRDGLELEKTVTLCAPSEQHAISHLLDAAMMAPQEVEIINYDVLSVA